MPPDDLHAASIEAGLRADVEESLGGQLQDLLEPAARDLGRPLAIDDRHLRLLAYTEHPDEIDPMRKASVLRQPLPPKVIAWLEQHGIRRHEGPLELPANPEFGMAPRVCVPIRCHGHLLGFLWLVDRDRTTTADEQARAAAVADAAGLVLYRELVLQDLRHSRERELLRDVLSDDEDVRSHALAELVESDLFVGGALVALVAPTPPVQDAAAPESVRVAVDGALSRVRRRIAPKHALHLLRPDHALLVVSPTDPGLRWKGVRPLAAQLAGELRDALGRAPGERQVVGVGGRARTLEQARESYAQAQRCARVAQTVRSFGDVAVWEDLGIYQLLGELPADALNAAMIPAGLRELIDDPHAHALVHTLEVFLDRAGDVQATASELVLHRTSLYHRLRRAERLAGIDLRDGEQRLAVHLGLKLARLQGLSWAAAPGGDAQEPRGGDGGAPSPSPPT